MPAAEVPPSRRSILARRAPVASGGRLQSPRVKLAFGWVLPGRQTLVTVACVFLGILGWRHYAEALFLAPGDRSLVLDAERVALLVPGFRPRAEAERFEKGRVFPLGSELVYHYHDPADPRAPELRVVTRVGTTEYQAKLFFAAATANTALDWELDPDGEIGLVPLDDHFHWGDESRSFRVLDHLQPIGTSFCGRSGASATYVMLRGVGLSPEDLAFLLEPVLAALEAAASAG